MKQSFIKKIIKKIHLFKKDYDQLTNYELGKHGEKIAEKFLKKKGYIILDKNFKCKYGEIDIIAKDNNCIVFVEVKTRRKAIDIMPEDSIGKVKQKHLTKAAEYYLYTKKYEDIEYRIDIVSIELNNKSSNINLIKDAL